MKKHLSILALCSALAACSATGAQFDMGELKNPPVGNTQLVVYREGGFIGSAENPMIEANGKNICNLPQGSFILASLPAGKIDISADFFNKPMGKYSFDAKPRQIYYIQVAVNTGQIGGSMLGAVGGAVTAASQKDSSPFYIKRVYEDSALKDLGGLKQSTDCK
jgi:hypothetical protein